VTARRPDAARGREAPIAGILPLVVVLAVALVVAACGTSSGSPSATSGAPSAAASATPAAEASDDVGAGPQPTNWPGPVIEAVLNLAKADLEIKEAGGDLGAAATTEDLEAIWGAADGLATLIGKLQPQVDRMRDYPATAAAVAAYDAAFPDMRAGATKIRDSITAGDAEGVTAGFQQLATGTAAYEQARAEIGPLVQPALLMQRILVK
jgi:hypothetical protein